jgi:O-antigen ligase
VRTFLEPLLFFQRFFLPVLIGLVLWAAWRTFVKRDLGVGLAFYLGLVIIVDGFLNTGLFIPGLERGSIRYSELCAVSLFFARPPAAPSDGTYKAIRILVALYFLLLLLSAFRSDSVMAGIFEFRMRIVSQIVAFVIAVRGLRSPEDYRRFFWGLTVLAVLLALFVFWDIFFDRWLISSDMLSKPEYYMNRRHGRFGSFFLNPNYLGAFTVLVFPGVFAWALNETRWILKAFAGSGLIALGFCLVETQSRGPVLAFAIVLFLLLLGPAGGMSRVRRLGLAVPLFGLFALLMPGFIEHASGRFDTIEQEASTEGRSRMTVWQYTQRAIADHPLAGIGFGEQQFLRVMEDYGFREEYAEESLDNPHNSYLQITVYAGYPALFAFVLGNLLLLFRAMRATLRGVPDGMTGFTFGLAVGIGGFLTVIYPDMHMFTQTVAPVYWVAFGLLLALTTSSNSLQAKVQTV